MSRVFIVQAQKEIDQATGEIRDKFDFAPAERFGRLIFLLGPGATALDTTGAICELRKGLAEINDQDWIIPTGNPILIGLAFAIAADLLSGRLRLLQWSGPNRCYSPITVENLYDDTDEEEFAAAE